MILPFVVECEHVGTLVDGNWVHRDVNLHIRAGEIFSLLGGSGSGKTLLLREMIGLMQPAYGEIRLFGLDWKKVDDKSREKIRSRWGVLFQQGALISAMTVFDNIALPLRELHVLDEVLVGELVMQKLVMTGLDAEVADKLPAALSGGMVKRVALARALALEPELIFLDEPTSGLDPVAGVRFRALIEQLHQQLGLTVVMITHDQGLLEGLSNRVGILADGCIIAEGTVEEVKKVDHPFIQSYFSPELVLIDGAEG